MCVFLFLGQLTQDEFKHPMNLNILAIVLNDGWFSVLSFDF